MQTPSERYPALMTYIYSRNQLAGAANWCAQLREDEAEAREGGLADVAAQMKQAKADFAADATSKGLNPYPYNRSMGEFLGLDIRDNGEPTHGYYMASGVETHFAFGEAKRSAEALIAEGKPLRVVAARSKKTRQPVRFLTFCGPEQIKIEGNTVTACDGKRRVRLSSSWSEETCLQNVVAAMISGRAYGERAPALRL